MQTLFTLKTMSVHILQICRKRVIYMYMVCITLVRRNSKMPVLEAEITILDVVEDKPLNELVEKQVSEAMSGEPIVAELDSTMPPQHTLVARALRGEQEAFNDIVTQYGSL